VGSDHFFKQGIIAWQQLKALIWLCIDKKALVLINDQYLLAVIF